MNRKFFIAWLVVFVVWFLGSFVVHGVLLNDDYMVKHAELFRPPEVAQQKFPWMVLAHVMLSGALVWIYSRGAEAKPWMAQGIRFGIAVAFLTVVPTYMIYYVVQPMLAVTVFKQMLFDGILMVILGMVVAFMYRAAPAPAATAAAAA